MFHEPIDNWWGNIPSGFEDLRKKARDGRWTLEDVLEKLRGIEEATDPEKALSLAEEIEGDWGDHISLPKKLFDEDFWSAVQYHKRRYGQLVEAGLLTAYQAFHRTASEKLVQHLAPLMPLPRDRILVLTTQYDPDTLLDLHHAIRVVDCRDLWPERPPAADRKWDDIPKTWGVLSSKPGNVESFLVAGRHSYQMLNRNHEWVDTPGSWADRIKDVVSATVGELLERVLALRFGE
jgi:hypothetical protein